MSGPCGWLIERCGGCGKCWEGMSPELRDRAGAAASAIVWAATGRRYGLCELTVLPCNPPAQAPAYETFPVARGYDAWALGGGSGLSQPVIESGQWRNRCGGGCSCTAACEVPLDGPVFDITEVLIDGEAVDPAAYEVHNGYLLVRTDGDCWPSCQAYGVEVPGFQVTYRRGEDIPGPILMAAEMLACEYGKACQGKACALPARLTRLSRQGVEVEVEANRLSTTTGSRARIRTGIRVVDDILEADNPYGLAERPMVSSPDLVPPRVVTWRGGS